MIFRYPVGNKIPDIFVNLSSVFAPRPLSKSSYPTSVSGIIVIYIYIYKVEKKIQTDYTFISTSLFRGCPLVRRFNKNILYHRLHTI